MWYVFGTLGLGRAPAAPPPQYDAMDDAISVAMQDYWTNFATKTGDPNGGTLPRWRRFEEPARPYIDFSAVGPIMREGLRKPFCDLHIENSARLARG
jgi:carboxylesterase type B